MSCLDYAVHINLVWALVQCLSVDVLTLKRIVLEYATGDWPVCSLPETASCLYYKNDKYCKCKLYNK
jgi:hypothetical protein